MTPTAIIFPSSYFSDTKPDEDLQAEFDAVQNTGLFEILLFSYEKWFHEGKLSMNRKCHEPVCAVYRGWMMKPEQYAAFYHQLQAKGITLITAPEEYARFHLFPNIYPALGTDTAPMLVFPDGKVDLNAAKDAFPRFMVKDYVKSVKGTQFPKFFDRSITQAEFDRHMEEFYKLRGDLYTGGICIKEYLPLKRYGEHVNEYRVFYMNHEIGTFSRNSGQGNYTAEPPRTLLVKYQNLGSPYYTIDYAELESGEWKALETGDGQVSGLSDHQDYHAYFRTLFYAFREES